MCGIVGIIGRHEPVSERGKLSTMRDAMHHRGPDDAGEWWSNDGRIGLGHRRLSIIDLSTGGHQPMKSEDGTAVIVFNGEIYNYQELRKELRQSGYSFRSSSDTEVILAAWNAWGEDCLKRLVGMFSIAIYDSRKNILFIARDRPGEKPLFYYQDNDRFAFASELKGLLADPNLPRRMDPIGLDLYLCHGYVPGNKCILSGYSKLPAGSYLILNLNSWKIEVKKYWSLPAPDREFASEKDLVDELDKLMSDSVRRQLAADVPVGVLLSGGLDSSLVTAFASRVSSRPVKTFTITFPDNKKSDESEHARLVARHFGTEHIELGAQPTSVDLLPELIRQYDEPMCDSSMVPTYLVSCMIRKHCTVALGGDGADELFGGYTSYQWALKQRILRQRLPSFLRNSLGWVATNMMPVGMRGRNYLLGMRGSLAEGMAGNTMFFNRAERMRMCPVLSKAVVFGAAEAAKAIHVEIERDLPGMAMGMDFNTYLCEDILVKVDRASMLASLEVRSPFLDHRIIEFAFSKIPNRLRADVNMRKIILRRLGERLLPDTFDFKRKQGFSLPLQDWFKGSWGDYMSEVALSLPCDWIRQHSVNDLIDSLRQGRRNTERLFSLVVLGLWRSQYNITL